MADVPAKFPVLTSLPSSVALIHPIGKKPFGLVIIVSIKFCGIKSGTDLSPSRASANLIRSIEFPTQPPADPSV